MRDLISDHIDDPEFRQCWGCGSGDMRDHWCHDCRLTLATAWDEADAHEAQEERDDAAREFYNGEP